MTASKQTPKGKETTTDSRLHGSFSTGTTGETDSLIAPVPLPGHFRVRPTNYRDFLKPELVALCVDRGLPCTVHMHEHELRTTLFDADPPGFPRFLELAAELRVRIYQFATYREGSIEPISDSLNVKLKSQTATYLKFWREAMRTPALARTC